MSSTETLITALRILAREIQSDDGVANAAIAEAADRLEDLQRENAALREELKEANRLLHVWSPDSVKARKEAQP